MINNVIAVIEFNVCWSNNENYVRLVMSLHLLNSIYAKGMSGEITGIHRMINSAINVIQYMKNDDCTEMQSSINDGRAINNLIAVIECMKK